MNELIEEILSGLTVDGSHIPYAFLYYEGHGEPYITYMEESTDNSFSGDNGLVGFVHYYDFDVYSTGNYFPILEALRTALEANGFVWQPSRSSSDYFEPDTHYYHRTYNFAYMWEEN